MERNKRKEFKEKPLYSKVNTTCHGGKIHHGNQKEYSRHKKEDILIKSKMRGGDQNHGLNFSPLYAFLRKNVGKNWNELRSEIKYRIPKKSSRNIDPFDGTVLSFKEYQGLTEDELSRPYFGNSESSYHSLLFVDEQGDLQFVNKDFEPEKIKIKCKCCTYTFNSNKINKKFKE